jgi:ubiquinone/menaquinone biosynthesis C-methylase UbiE
LLKYIIALTQADHIALLEGGIQARGGFWADLGSGTGAFTVALAKLLGGEGRILSVDRDARALAVQERTVRGLFPRLDLQVAARDFTTLSGVSGLDGILMANSLHFQQDAEEVLRRVGAWLAPGGSLLIVEYDVEGANPWVPYPVPFRRLVGVAQAAGYAPARLLATRPSRYHGSVYSAIMQQPAA